MKKESFNQEKDAVLGNIRECVIALAKIRIRILEIKERINPGDTEAELALEELEEAVDGLYSVEYSLGLAHNSILVSMAAKSK